MLWMIKHKTLPPLLAMTLLTTSALPCRLAHGSPCTDACEATFDETTAEIEADYNAQMAVCQQDYEDQYAINQLKANTEADKCDNDYETTSNICDNDFNTTLTTSQIEYTGCLQMATTGQEEYDCLIARQTRDQVAEAVHEGCLENALDTLNGCINRVQIDFEGENALAWMEKENCERDANDAAMERWDEAWEAYDNCIENNCAG